MNKGEFLEGLRERLSGEIPEYKVREHLRYYDNYLSGEIQAGKTEEEAVQALGNPYLIAKTILDMEEQEEPAEETTEEETQESSYYYREETPSRHRAEREIKMRTWHAKVLFFVVLLLILIFIFAVVGSLMALLLQFLFPILVIGLLVYLFKKGKTN